MNIILSINPKHIEKIISKEKKYEFRKTNFSKKNIFKSIMYATRPVGMLVGEFTIIDIHQDSPSNIWEKTKNFAGVSKEEFDAYFSGKTKAIAIEIGDLILYDTPKKISSISKKVTPPQSFCYIQ